jgi:hypothetical protein
VVTGQSSLSEAETILSLIWTNVGLPTLQQRFSSNFLNRCEFYSLDLLKGQRDQGTGTMTTTAMIIIWVILGFIAISAALR